MQSIPQLVNDLALLLAVAAVATIVCRRFKQPLVLGYVVAGFLVSPAIGWIPNIVETADVSTWSQIGVIFLMFGLGLQFSVVKLTTVGRPALVTAVVEMSLMIAAGFACGTLLGWSPSTSLFLGGMLAISSSSIIVKTFGELGLRTKAFAQLVFGVLVIEDIAGVFLLVVLSTVAVSASVDGGAVAVRIGRMALYLVVWFALSVILVPSALKRLRSELNDEILLIASIALCLGMVVLADAIGFSSALGAFLAGSILAGTVQAKRVDALFKPIQDLFGAVFFVSVGMLVTPAAVTENLGAIVVIALVAIIGRSLFCGLGALLSGATLKTSVMSGLSLAQIGEFSFIIAALGSATGVTPDFLYPVIVTVSVATTLASPLLVKNSERIYHLLVRVLPESLFALRHEHLERAQEEDGEPNLWVDYLKRWTLKLGLVVLAGIASVEVLMNTALPLLSGFVPEAVLNPLLAAVGIFVTGLFLSNLFYTGRKNEFGVLWMKSRRNHVPLAVLMLAGGAASCGVVAYIVHAAGARQSVWMFVLAATCSLLLARSRTLHSWFLKLETSFVGNLNESILAERLAESDEEERAGWVEERLYVVEVEASRTLRRLGAERSSDFLFGIAHNLDLMAIEREGVRMGSQALARLTKEELVRRINDPADPLGIREGDVLTFLGTENEVDAYLQTLLKEDSIDEADAVSASFDEYAAAHPDKLDLACVSLSVEAGSPFAGKTIGAVDFKGSFGCLVVAHEHEKLLKMKPSRNTRLFPDDRIWLVGETAAAQALTEPTRTAEAPDEETAAANS